jgi:hypothetical protein
MTTSRPSGVAEQATSIYEEVSSTGHDAVSATSSKVEARVQDVQVPTHKSELIRAVHAIRIDIRRCDEGCPSCLTCKKHGVLCDFETAG